MLDRLSPSVSSGSTVDDENRPNRFKGPDSTWRGYTKDERSLAASLDGLRANDLSAHLYSAHALKARLYEPQKDKDSKPWSAKRQWMKRDDTGEPPWHPDPQWTAWPLPAEDVPRKEETFGRSLEDLVAEQDTFRKEESWVPCADLREEVQALMLRKAKQRFRRRTWTSAEDVMDRGRKEASVAKAGNRASTRSRSRSRSRVPADGEGDPEDRESNASEAPPTLPEENMTPVFIADDARASRVLDPGVNHILSRFEDLLVGLHRSRMGHVKGGVEKQRTEDPETKARRRQDLHQRQRDGLGVRDWSEVMGIASLTGWDPAVVNRATKRCASLFGEGMSLRTMPETASSRLHDSITDYVPDTAPLSPSATSSGSKDTDHELSDIKAHYCPLASCNRSSIPFEQCWRLRAHLRRSHKYTNGDLDELFPEHIKSEASSRASSHARIWEPPDPLVCPHNDCRNPEKVYPATRRLVEHIRRAHGYDPRDESPSFAEEDWASTEDLLVGKENGMVGGVHSDGFLARIVLDSAAPSRRATPAQTPSRGRSFSGDEGERATKRVKAGEEKDTENTHPGAAEDTEDFRE